MKTAIAALFAVLLIGCSACGDIQEETKITDLLKINAWVMADGLWETGYWEFDPTYKTQGRWVSNDGTEIDHDDVFRLERLEVGIPRVSAPLGYNSNHNLNLWFDFDGIIEVEKAGPKDERLWMVHSLDEPEQPWRGTLTKQQKIRMKSPSAVSLVPVGKFSNLDSIRTSYTLPDNEYNLIIRAYDYDGTLMITAEVRLVALDDPTFPFEDFSSWAYSPNEVKTRFLSIELVSYEYSDIYKLDEAEELQ